MYTALSLELESTHTHVSIPWHSPSQSQQEDNSNLYFADIVCSYFPTSYPTINLTIAEIEFGISSLMTTFLLCMGAVGYVEKLQM